MARLVGSRVEVFADDVLKNYAKTTWSQMRPGRCTECRIGIARPFGGATNHDLSCPLCGGACIQSTWGSKQARGGYVVLSRAESLALARGETVTVDRRLTSALVAGMDIHDIYDRIPVAPESELAILNAELRRRLP